MSGIEFFVGRNGSRAGDVAAVFNFLCNPERRGVLTVSGFFQVGKSSVVQEAERRLKEDGHLNPIPFQDIEHSPLTPERVLDMLRGQLDSRPSIDLPTRFMDLKSLAPIIKEAVGRQDGGSATIWIGLKKGRATDDEAVMMGLMRELLADGLGKFIIEIRGESPMLPGNLEIVNTLRRVEGFKAQEVRDLVAYRLKLPVAEPTVEKVALIVEKLAGRHPGLVSLVCEQLGRTEYVVQRVRELAVREREDLEPFIMELVSEDSSKVSSKVEDILDNLPLERRVEFSKGEIPVSLAESGLAIQSKLPRIVQEFRRRKVFLSYASKDYLWAEQLKTMFLSRADGNFELWDFRLIPPGVAWEERIREELDKARLVVILVSAKYLASDFVRNTELPWIKQAAEEGRIEIRWVLLSSCGYDAAGLDKLQAAHDIARPLASLDGRAKKDRVLDDICRELVKTLKFY